MTSSAYPRTLWSLSLILTLIITFHVIIVLSYHLFNRFVLKNRESKRDSEFYRTLYGYCTLAFGWMSVVTVHDNGSNINVRSNATCKALAYTAATLQALIQWGLVGFLLSKARVARDIMAATGKKPSSLYLPVFIVSHVACLLYLLSSVTTIDPHLDETSHGIYECEENTGMITSMIEGVILISQILLSYIFVSCVYDAYRAQRAFSVTQIHRTQSDVEVEESLREVVKQNAIWGVISIASLLILSLFHVISPHTRTGYNWLTLISMFVFVINNFVMVRIMGWPLIYGQYLDRINCVSLLCPCCAPKDEEQLGPALAMGRVVSATQDSTMNVYHRMDRKTSSFRP